MRPASSAHEALVEFTVPKAPSERAFGLTVGGILAAIAVLRALGGAGLDLAGIVLLAVAVPLIAVALLAAPRLAPLNRLWTRLGLLLGRIVNPVVMLLLFAVAFVPTGLVMRAFGHDPLRRHLDRAAAGYWIPRDTDPASSMRNQF